MSVKWQPIETAPKDGTKVLLWTPQYGGQSFIDWLTFEGELGARFCVATHWMHLPKPPPRFGVGK